MINNYLSGKSKLGHRVQSGDLVVQLSLKGWRAFAKKVCLTTRGDKICAGDDTGDDDVVVVGGVVVVVVVVVVVDVVAEGEMEIGVEEEGEEENAAEMGNGMEAARVNV